MGLVDSISRTVNYGLTGFDQTVRKIAAEPTAAKKVLQIADKILAAFDLYYTGKIHPRDITHVIKGTTDLIEFYGSYKDLRYWASPFSKESLDKKLLRESITDTLTLSHRSPEEIKEQIKLAKKVYKDVTKKEAYYSKGEVQAAFVKSLMERTKKSKHPYNAESAKKLAERIIVKQKGDSPLHLFCTACETLSDLSDNIFTLQKWNILDLSHVAAAIGSQSRAFMFVIDLGAEKVFGVIGSVCLILTIGETSYQAIIQTIKVFSATTKPEEKEKAYKELRNALLDLMSGVTDLAATAAPLIYTLNPPALVALALVSKGTGLLCFLVK